jgi:hypothetical protein
MTTNNMLARRFEHHSKIGTSIKCPTQQLKEEHLLTSEDKTGTIHTANVKTKLFFIYLVEY